MKLEYIGNEKINIKELHFEEVELLEDLLRDELESIKEFLDISYLPDEETIRMVYRKKKRLIEQLLIQLEDWIAFIPKEYDQDED